MKKILLCIACVAMLLPASAQVMYNFYDSIPVVETDGALINPWAGGFNSPQFSEADLNGDGFMDLFSFDRDGNVIKVF